MPLQKLYGMHYEERKTENTGEKMRDLDNAMRKSNRHFIRVSGGQQGEKWPGATSEEVTAMNLQELMKDSKPQTQEEYRSQTKELKTNLWPRHILMKTITHEKDFRKRMCKIPGEQL